MYALRERRVHVTQEDFEMAVAKVRTLIRVPRTQIQYFISGYAKRVRKEHVYKTNVSIVILYFCLKSLLPTSFLEKSFLCSFIRTLECPSSGGFSWVHACSSVRICFSNITCNNNFCFNQKEFFFSRRSVLFWSFFFHNQEDSINSTSHVPPLAFLNFSGL